MPFNKLKAASAMLMAGVALAEPLATITPCAIAPSASSTPACITVTEQYQPVSTCSATSRCHEDGSCETRYPYTTWSYVNTVIPCAYDGKTASTTTVTSIDQSITVSKWSTTITNWEPATVTLIGGPYHNSTKVVATSTAAYTTIAKEFVLPYNKIGPLAIPGYGGCGLCKECDTQADGSKNQPMDVTECRSGPEGPRCVKYAETWISKPAPSTTSATACPVSTKIIPTTTGAYTFVFPQWAPAATYTSAEHVYTAPAQPYYVYVVKYCNKPYVPIDFTTTVTKTITWTAPYNVIPPTTSSKCPFPTGGKGGFPGFPKPRPGDNWNPPQPTGAGGWEDWPAAPADPVHPTTMPSNNHWYDWNVYTSSTYGSSYSSSSSAAASSSNAAARTSTTYYSSSSSSSSAAAATSTTSISSSSSSSSSAAAASSSSAAAAASNSFLTSSSLAASSSAANAASQRTSSSSSSAAAATSTTSISSSSSSSSSAAASSSSVSSSSAAASSSSSSSAAASSSSSSSAAASSSSSSSSAASSSSSSSSAAAATSTTSISSSSSSSSAAAATSTTSISSSSSSSSSAAASSSSVSSSSAAASSSSSSSAAASSSSSSASAASSSSSSSAAASSSSSSSSASAASSSSSSSSAAATSLTTTSATSVTATTSTITSAPPSQTNIFVIIVIRTGAKYRKRADEYITFNGGDGFITTDQSAAASFRLDGQFLRSGDFYIGTDALSGFGPFSAANPPPTTERVWGRNGDVLTLSAAQAGFCVRSSDGGVVIGLDSLPADCPTFALVARAIDQLPATSTSTSSVSSTSTTTSSGTPNPSDDPTLEPRLAAARFRRGVTYGGTHAYMRRHL